MKSSRSGRAILGVTLVITLSMTAVSNMLAQKSAPSRSTLSGVYSAEQASRGADVYAGLCRSCHTAASHTGATFEKLWIGHSLAELFGYVSTRMPKNEPGSLEPEQYADVVAYLLKLNDMPAGTSELMPDSTALATIRIEAHTSTTKPQNR
jgi:quinoprotein glucose dehydrogenase